MIVSARRVLLWLLASCLRGLQSARNFVRVGAWEQYAYDASGNLTTVTDPRGGVSRYHNDANGRITQIVDADGVVEVNNTYDSSDRVISQTMSSGNSASFVYDTDNLRTVLTHQPSGSVVTYSYDGAGRVTSIVDPLGATISKTYDAAGNWTGCRSGVVEHGDRQG